MKCFRHNYEKVSEDDAFVYMACTGCPEHYAIDKQLASAGINKKRKKQSVQFLDDMTPAEEEAQNEPPYVKRMLQKIGLS